MPTWEDVIAIGQTLAGTEVSTWYRTPALKVNGRGFARLRTESDGGLVLRCEPDDKVALLAREDPAFYTTAHYDGYDAILVDLARVDPEMLTVLVTGAWKVEADKPAKRRRSR